MHNQCRVFESCFRNECKLDFIGKFDWFLLADFLKDNFVSNEITKISSDCPGGVCAPHHVCVAGRCLRDPLAPAGDWKMSKIFSMFFQEIKVYLRQI